MCFEVLQKHAGAGEWLQAHLAGEVSIVGGVKGKMALETQLCVIALAALLTCERLLVRVMSVQVVLQVILPVEHLLTVRTLVVFLW